MSAHRWAIAASVLCLVLASACGRQSASVTHAATVPIVSPSADSPNNGHLEVRATGKIRAVRFFTVQTPQLSGQGGRLTLTALIANGVKVKKDDPIAEFDSTQEDDKAREARAKFEDLGHQVEQRAAQNRADAEKRTSDLRKAEADLAKARIQLSKGPLLAEIDRLKAEAKLGDAQAHVASLQKSNHSHEVADAAALHILELQRDRQKVMLDRALNNISRLQVKAPLAGMVAIENIWRSGSMGPAQEGDQLFTGQAIARIFDPSEMEVQTVIGEPDGAVLGPGCRAEVRLDAYPDLVFPARFVSASPVAASALGSPIKTFAARFHIEKSDPHLLPDLSAAVVIRAAEKTGAAGGAQ
jgi:HlyD family secretion protein